MRRNSSVHYHIAHNFPAYPNQADTNYYLKKLTEIAARLASGIGLMLFIILLARMM